MLKFLKCKINRLFLAGLLFVSILVANPNVAQADKAVKSIVFDPASTIVNVAAIYETTPETQKDVVSSIMKSSKSFFKKVPGFSSFSVLQSEDGTRVVALSQWQDAASYEAYLAQPVEDYSKEYSKFSKPGKPTLEPTRTVMLEVDQTQVATGFAPGLRGKDVLVQFSEITAKSAEDAPKLLDSVEASLPDTTKLYPAPRSAVLFRGLDSPGVVVLANWGIVEEFEDVSKLPALNVLPDSVAPLADHDSHLYEVVKIIAAKPESEQWGKD